MKESKMTDEEIIQSSTLLGAEGHYELNCCPGNMIQCRNCKRMWHRDHLLYYYPVAVCTASNTPFVPDPELFPLGDGSNLDEDTKPGRKQVESTIWQPFQGVEFVEKKCECGVDKIGGGAHSSWCPKAE
jgi:hypothetical protein